MLKKTKKSNVIVCRSTFCALIILSVSNISRADIKLADIFSNNMVLQRDINLPVWGTAEPGEKVTVNFNCQTISAITDNSGKWIIKLQPLQMDKSPQKMTVTGENQNFVLNNILVGDVWLCSGQSNMVLPLSKTENATQEIAAADFPLLRLNSHDWQVCSPKTAGDFSAVGYYFGKELQSKLNIPIGLINRSRNGSAIELWLPKDAMKENPITNNLMKIANSPEIKQEIQTYLENQKISKNKTMSPTVEKYYQYLNPGLLYENLIRPIIPFGIKGMIWYQGEANSKNDFAAYNYRITLPLLIKSFRDNWQQGNFPFYYVQLPIYRPGISWQITRESMLETLNVPNTGMAVIIDSNEPENLHPLNKRLPGQRLALWALAKTYKKDIVYSGPLYKSYSIKDGKIYIKFDHTANGLKSNDGKPLNFFEIASEDKCFKTANADIQDNTVIVYNENIKNPIAVRFCFSNDQIPNLSNSQGFPASPFRTDKWPVVNDYDTKKIVK